MIRKISFYLLALPVVCWAQSSDEKLLHDAEVSRGVLSANGIQWTVRAQSESKGNETNATLIVKAQGPHALAEMVAPMSSKGNKYLLSSGDMWFYRKDSKRAVSVPKRQRVAGDAAIGDIASSSFLAEYQIVGTTKNNFNGEACSVFDLKKRSGASPTYARIQLWISDSARVSRQAQFYTTSGKHIRTATFKHNNTVKVGGKSIPFLSELKVVELIGTPKTTVLRFTDYSIRSFPSSLFNKSALPN